MLSGCSFIEKGGRGRQDRRVARIGQEVLYESDIVRLMPEGVSSADSATMVSRYINTWALGRLMLLKAEEQLSKAERDVTAEVEEFRSTLLGFRFEKRWIEERLDTTVTLEEARLYYEEHPSSSIFPIHWLKHESSEFLRVRPTMKQLKGHILLLRSRMWQNLESCVIPLPSVIPILEGIGYPFLNLQKSLAPISKPAPGRFFPKKVVR